MPGPFVNLATVEQAMDALRGGGGGGGASLVVADGGTIQEATRRLYAEALDEIARLRAGLAACVRECGEDGGIPDDCDPAEWAAEHVRSLRIAFQIVRSKGHI